MLADGAGGTGRVNEWSPFFKLFRASHPSVATRIEFSNTYRPWLDGEPLVYERDFAPRKRGRMNIPAARALRPCARQAANAANARFADR